MPLFIFDLDGTLIDSSRDLAISTNAMLRHMGRAEIDEQTVNSYVGDGAAKLVRRAIGDSVTEEEFEAAYKFFIRYYRDHSLENTRLYDGMEDALRTLQQSGSTLAVLTNKPVKISRERVVEIMVAAQEQVASDEALRALYDACADGSAVTRTAA